MSLDHWLEPPNWGRPVEEDYEFRTEVITARDGSEQRIRERLHPRISLRWESQAKRGTLRRVERRLAAAQGRAIVAMHPRLRARLQEDVAAAQDQFDIALPRPFWLDAGREALIVLPDGTWLIRAIADAVGSAIVLPAPIGVDVPQGSLLCPPVYARFDSGVAVTSETNRLGELVAALRAVPGLNPTLARSFGAAAQTYKGRELFTLAPNWAGGVASEFVQMRDIFDFGRGGMDYLLFRDRTDRTLHMRFMVRDDANLDTLLGCFYRAAGRQRAFYAPVWTESFTPVLPLSAGVNFAVEGGSEHFDAYAGQTMYRHIMVRTRSGGDFFREVIGWTVDGGGNSVMVLDAALPAITAGDFVTARWLLRTRFASDLLTIAWRTRTIGECDVALYALEDDE